MTKTIPSSFTVSPEVARSLEMTMPVVALESTVITHGLPRPQNLSLARDMEQGIISEGAIPAIIAVLDGRVRIGLVPEDLERLAHMKDTLKITRRDFAAAQVKQASGGTTVAATMYAAQKAGIEVFATGGIGGVHREGRFDVSTDLQALADTPMIVVCSGAKAILDLPATLEYLETMSVPVVGYKTDTFPAFYSAESDLPVSVRIDSPEAVVGFARSHWDIGFNSSILVAQPPPEKSALKRAEIDPLIRQASKEAVEKNLRGKELTPFLLARVSELSGGKSLRVNIDLLVNNARLAAQISNALAATKRHRFV